MNIIIIELAHVGRAVSPAEVAEAMLLAVLKLTLELASVRPNLDSKAVLAIVDPGPRVLAPIIMLVCSLTVRLVIPPLAEVTVALRVDDPAEPMRAVVLPVAFELASILPDQNSLSFAVAVLVPLALVDCPVI